MTQPTRTHRRSFRLLGDTITVRYSEHKPNWLRRLAALLRPAQSDAFPPGRQTVLTVHRPGPDTLWRIEQDGTLTTFQNEDVLVRELEWRMYVSAVRHSSLPLVLHAGAAVRDGCSLLLPAASGAGKTTLTLALVSRGWLPLADDLCAFREEAGVLTALPVRRCAHVDKTSRRLLKAHCVALAGPVGGLDDYHRPRAWGAAAPVRLIVAPRYEPGADVRVTPYTQAEGAALLMASSFEQEPVSKRSQWMTAMRLACQTPTVSLTYSRLDDAFHAIDALAAQLNLESQRTADACLLHA